MPLQPIIPIWGGLNNANSASATGLIDPVTGQQYNTGGLEVGDYFDLTEKEANTLSVSATGTCHSGRYRYVKIDSSATAANVKTGTVGYLRNGSTVASAVILTAGSGQTAGTYQIAANAGIGGGSGAVLGVVVGSAGTIISVFVVNPGFGYSSLPTFTVAAGGTPGTIAAQLNTTPNLVTSYDQEAAGFGVPARPVVYLNSITPGNYGFIQELGVATVLGNASFTGTATVGGAIAPKASGAGTVEAPASATAILNSTIGLAIDLPVVSNLFKILLGYAATVVQD
jgi:hypothetical protein